MRQPLALAALALLATGCVSGGPGERQPVPPENDPVGRQWMERDPLPRCGMLDIDQGQRWRAAGPKAFDCFDDALRTGGQAELAVVYPTIEGDPIRVWYRVLGDRMEVYQDASADAYGGDTTWTFTECSAPDRLRPRGHPNCR